MRNVRILLYSLSIILLFVAKIGISQTAEEFRDRGMGAYAFTDDYSGAIVDLTKAIELDPKDDGAYYFRALCKHKLKDHFGAISDFNQAIKICTASSTKALYLNGRGITKDALQDFRGAIDDFSISIELQPESYEAHYNRGNAKAFLSDYKGALIDFNHAIKIKPNYIMALRDRGLTYGRHLTNHEAAIRDFSKIIELDSNNADAYFNRGIARLLFGQKDGGCRDLSKAGELGYYGAYEKIKSFCN